MKSTDRNMKRPKKILIEFGSNWILCLCFIWLLIFVKSNECASIKRSASPQYNDDNSESSSEHRVSYDEYPVSAKQR